MRVPVLPSLFHVILLVISTNLYADVVKEKPISAVLSEEERVSKVLAQIKSFTNHSRVRTDWEQQLVSQGQSRVSPVLTVELQRLWLQKYPILFVGTIDDLEQKEKGHFSLTVTRAGALSSDVLIDTHLMLRLSCSKRIGERLLRGYAISGDPFDNVIAVSATITSIESIDMPLDQGRTRSVRTGVGGCVDAIYLEDY